MRRSFPVLRNMSPFCCCPDPLGATDPDYCVMPTSPLACYPLLWSSVALVWPHGWNPIGTKQKSEHQRSRRFPFQGEPDILCKEGPKQRDPMSTRYVLNSSIPSMTLTPPGPWNHETYLIYLIYITAKGGQTNELTKLLAYDLPYLPT